MKNLNLSVIKEALDASYDLISSEYDSVCDEDLQREYQKRIDKAGRCAEGGGKED